MKKISFLDALKKEPEVEKSVKNNNNNDEDENNTKKTKNNINNNSNDNQGILQGYTLKNPDTEFDDIYSSNIIDIKFDFMLNLKYEFLNHKFFNINNNISKYNFYDFIKLSSNNYIDVINDVNKYNNECIEEDNNLNEMLDEGLDEVMMEFNEGIFGQGFLT